MKCIMMGAWYDLVDLGYEDLEAVHVGSRQEAEETFLTKTRWMSS